MCATGFTGFGSHRVTGFPSTVGEEGFAASCESGVVEIHRIGVAIVGILDIGVSGVFGGFVGWAVEWERGQDGP